MYLAIFQNNKSSNIKVERGKLFFKIISVPTLEEIKTWGFSVVFFNFKSIVYLILS